MGWDEDSDDEAAPASASELQKGKHTTSSVASSQTLNPTASARDDSRLDPSDAKRKISADGDSEASYDVVGARSGVPSQAPGSPRQDGKKGEESDEDWE